MAHLVLKRQGNGIQADSIWEETMSLLGEDPTSEKK